MNCPQCGTGLGEGAKACATCGWSKSRKTLWIVLGCVFGFLFLVCCGGGAFVFFKLKKVGEAMQAQVVPLQISVLKVQIVGYSRRHGKPPATLAEASTEPLVDEDGEKLEVHFESNGKSVDAFGKEFRFTMNPDRTFEIRSAGRDGLFDTADDVSGKGSLDDDLEELRKETRRESRRMGERIGEDIMKEFGVDPAKLKEAEKEKAAPAPAPAPPDGEKK